MLWPRARLGWQNFEVWVKDAGNSTSFGAGVLLTHQHAELIRATPTVLLLQWSQRHALCLSAELCQLWAASLSSPGHSIRHYSLPPKEWAHAFCRGFLPSLKTWTSSDCCIAFHSLSIRGVKRSLFCFSMWIHWPALDRHMAINTSKITFRSCMNLLLLFKYWEKVKGELESSTLPGKAQQRVLLAPNIIALQAHFYRSTRKLFRSGISRIGLMIWILSALVLLSALRISLAKTS